MLLISVLLFPLFILAVVLTTFFINSTKSFTNLHTFNFSDLFKLTLFFKVIVSAGLYTIEFKDSYLFFFFIWIFLDLFCSSIYMSILNNQSHVEINKLRTFVVIFLSFLISNIIIFLINISLALIFYS